MPKIKQWQSIRCWVRKHVCKFTHSPCPHHSSVEYGTNPTLPLLWILREFITNRNTEPTSSHQENQISTFEGLNMEYLFDLRKHAKSIVYFLCFLLNCLLSGVMVGIGSIRTLIPCLRTAWVLPNFYSGKWFYERPKTKLNSLEHSGKMFAGVVLWVVNWRRGFSQE